MYMCAYLSIYLYIYLIFHRIQISSSTSLIIREMQIKTPMRYHCHCLNKCQLYSFRQSQAVLAMGKSVWGGGGEREREREGKRERGGLRCV